MRRTPLLHPALALLLAALLTPSSGQATTATDLCAAAANPCTWSGNILVTAGSTLDFGARDLVITGSGIIRVNGGDTLTIKARRVTLEPGTLGRIRANTAASAPTINIEVTQDIILQRGPSTTRGRIDVKSSLAGGTIRLVAGGNVDMSGELLAQGTGVTSDGGFLGITAAGSVTLNGNIDVSGGLDAIGGDVLIEAGTNLVANSTMAAPEPLIDARGGLEGGSLDLAGGPLVDLGSRLIVNGTGPGSDGGFVTVEAQGNVRVRKQLAADGSGSIDFGGFGGDVSIVAGGTLTIDGDVSVSGGAPDGEGGTLDCFAGVDYVQNGRVLAQGPGDFAFGGTVLFSAGRTATLNGLSDLHGGSVGGGGYLSVQTGKEVKIQSEINANGDGGYILLSTLVTTPTGTAVAGPITVSGNIHANGTPGGLGGVNNIQGCDITVTPTGIVATTGPSDGENLFLASGKITARGTINALPGGVGANRMEYRDAIKAPDLAGATITPTAVQTLTASLPPCEAPAAAVCGNNEIEVGEACDGGNTTPCDGCSATCQLEFCGNGTKECTEDCDDNNTTDADGCDSNCTPTGCGNGIVTSPEECDNGALNGTPGSSCTIGCVIAGGPRCGNNRIDPGETCDDNNTDACDGCSATCQTECGNGIQECAEECDAGTANGAVGSSCSSTCIRVGAPCLEDTDCDPAGRCAGQMCDRELCVNVAPLACDDGNACNGAEACSANACVAGSAPSIEDGDSCTDDTCDPATGVAHTPKAGFDSVGCRLDAFETVLANASVTDASDKARAKFRNLVSGVRAKLNAARTATGKKKARMLKGVKTKLGKLSKAVRTAQKKDQIAGELAGRLTTAVSSATSAVQTLLVSP
jgi:cysteine-rich repeat protein